MRKNSGVRERHRSEGGEDTEGGLHSSRVEGNGRGEQESNWKQEDRQAGEQGVVWQGQTESGQR